MIDLRNVTKIYKMGETEIRALNGISLKVEKGAFLSLVGPSGSGKSTLLNIIGCIDTPTSGEVHLDGEDVSKLKDRGLTKIRLHKIGFIFQQFYLIPTLNAMENIELPMKEAKVPREERRKRTRQLLENVGLTQREKHYPNQLSGGEQQRVAIARSLANKPSVLLADEPTGEIDSETSEKIVNLLRKLNSEEKVTLLVVTHDLKVAKHADRMITIEDGKIVS
ncbi:MAG: ABC transporter ATP-binding protein [Thermoplasmata archaeon]|nr:MAG: ABC transporter ATP-binding protein [Thermoplasmata archaeon]